MPVLLPNGVLPVGFVDAGMDQFHFRNRGAGASLSRADDGASLSNEV
jgi:hypothetical protein